MLVFSRTMTDIYLLLVILTTSIVIRGQRGPGPGQKRLSTPHL